jgi:membrane protease YdiL (CAAX protease family)
MDARPVSAETDWSKVGLWGPHQSRRPWGPRDIWVGLGWLLGANVAVAIPVVISMMRADPLAVTPDVSTSTPVLAGGLIVLWAVFAGVPLWTTMRHGARSLVADFGWRVPTRADWTLGLWLGVVLRGVDLGSGWAATKLGWTTGDNSDWLFNPRIAVMTVFFVLAAAVVSPVLEELFFRGFIMGALNRVKHLSPRPRTWVAIALSSLIFGTLHTTALDASGLYVLCATGVAGAVLAVVATRRGNLGASMTTHIVFNATGVLFAWLAVR